MIAFVEELVSFLRKHPLVNSLRIINYDETPAGKVELKIRCRLIEGYRFQVWLHHEVDFQDYAFQLFTDHPILRWDNAPHYPDISTAPHHFHNESGTVSESMLTGQPLQDLMVVLAEIEGWLSKST